MKYALITSNEISSNGHRVCQVDTEIFEVAEPLFWVPCEDEVVPDHWYYDPTDNSLHFLDDDAFVHLLPAEPTYAEKRAAEYPPYTDYLDGVVKGDQAQIAKYIADCQAVKDKYPK
jgi:hypothetical protein